jgi:hypothetical protein
MRSYQGTAAEERALPPVRGQASQQRRQGFPALQFIARVLRRALFQQPTGKGFQTFPVRNIQVRLKRTVQR